MALVRRKVKEKIWKEGKKGRKKRKETRKKEEKEVCCGGQFWGLL